MELNNSPSRYILLSSGIDSNIILASNSKILVAPSMNPYMWENKATQDNLKTLKQRGVILINPNSGLMACGENGTGRLPEINEIFSFTTNYLLKKEVKMSIGFQSQLKILITAGPTQEKIDPIRYVSNNSSGKQGYALAEEFLKLGAHVTLISGPTNINKPNVNKFIEVLSAEEMLSQVENNIDCDIFISSAAVCDWKLIPYSLKNKKLSNNDKLKKNKDIFFKKEDGSIWADLTNKGLDEKLLLRSDGTSVYITQDIGTAYLRYKDHPDMKGMIYTTGNEQDYHFDVLFKVIGLIGYPWSSKLKHLSYGMVDLPTGKMKSREGTVVDADDLIDQMVEKAKSISESLGKTNDYSDAKKNDLYKTIALGALKYHILKVDPKKSILFDPNESIDFNGNTF